MRGLLLLLLVVAVAGGLILVLVPDPPAELARLENDTTPAAVGSADDIAAEEIGRVRDDTGRNRTGSKEDESTLPNTVPVTVIVRDARSQEPILDFQFTIEGIDTELVGEGIQAGRVNLPIGAYTLLVRSEGFVPADPKPFVVPGGSSSVEVVLELRAVAATVLLEVLDQSGQPIKPFNVTIRSFVGTSTAPTTEYLPAQEDNPLTIHADLGTRLELVVEAQGYTPADPIEVRTGGVAASEPHRVQAFLAAQMAFSGVEFRLVDEDSSPVANLEVVTEKLQPDGDYTVLWRRRSRNDTGVYRLPDLAPGRYRMRLRPTDQDWITTFHIPLIEELEITGNEHVIKPLTVHLGGTIHLTVTDNLGNTIGAGVRVGLRYPDGEIRTSLWRSFVEGQPNDDQVPLTEDHLREATPARLVDPVPAGGYALELRWGTGPVVVQPVRITPGARTPIRVTLDR